MSIGPGETRARRLFRAAGVAPLGVFVLLHVLSYTGWVAQSRDDQAGVAVLLGLLEVALVLAPLAFHAGYGLWLLLREGFGPAGSALTKLTRALALFSLVFVIDHFVRFRWPVLSGVAAGADVRELLIRELSATTFGVPAVAAFQCAGFLAVAFHLGYGLYRYEFPTVRALSSSERRLWFGVIVGLTVLLGGTASVIELATGKRFPFL